MKNDRRFLLLPTLTFLALGLAAPYGYAQNTAPMNATNVETRLMSLEEELRSMNGRLEQMEFTTHRLEQINQRLQADMDARLAKLEQNALSPTPPPAAVPTVTPIPNPTIKPQTSLPVGNPQTTVAGTLGDLKMQDGHITGGSVSPNAPALPDAPADYGLSPQEQFDRAFGLLRQANYDEAEHAFKTFIEKNPKDRQIDVAKYWYAETLYVRNHYDASAVAFADAYQQNPRGARAPDSLLNMALSLNALNKTSDACATLGELLRKFPHSAPSLRARATEEQTKMKCSKG